MRPLASLERFFERLFEGQSARLFHTKLQPIQLQRRVERAMESGRRRDGDRTVVPQR
ncbi:MAG: FhaA domain-containing protein, partial [Chloroflexota bacterium]